MTLARLRLVASYLDAIATGDKRADETDLEYLERKRPPAWVCLQVTLAREHGR